MKGCDLWLFTSRVADATSAVGRVVGGWSMILITPVLKSAYWMANRSTYDQVDLFSMQ
jgi:hypothetical protein